VELAGEASEPAVPENGAHGEGLARGQALALGGRFQSDPRGGGEAGLGDIDLLGDQLAGRPLLGPVGVLQEAVGGAQVLDGFQKPGDRVGEPLRLERPAGLLGRGRGGVQVLADMPPPLGIGDRGRDGLEARVDPGEQLLALGAGAAGDPGDAGLLRTELLEPAHVLGAVHAAAGRGELVDRFAGQRVDAAEGKRDGRRVAVEEGRAVEDLRSPGRQPLGGELGQGGRIARQGKGLVGGHPRGLVLAMVGVGHARKDRDHDLRLEAADHPDRVFEENLPGPEAEGLVERAGVAEVVGAGEILAAAVDLACGEELAGAEEAEADAQLGADQVLPPLAPAEREIGRLAPEVAGDESEKRRILVIRVGRDDQQAPVGGELGERPLDHGDAAGRRRIEGQGRQIDLSGRVGGGRQGQGEEQCGDAGVRGSHVEAAV
jgi:hypothetical protein